MADPHRSVMRFLRAPPTLRSVVWGSSFVLALLACMVFVTHRVNIHVGRRQALRNLTVTARLASEIVGETLEHTLLFERMLVEHPEFRAAVQDRDADRLRRLLQHFLPLAPGAEAAVIVAPSGAVIAAYPDRPELAGASLLHDEGFLGAQRGGWHSYVSAVHVRGGESLEKVSEVVLPIRDGTVVLAVLQVQHRVETIKSWIQKIRIDPGGFLYVVDQHDQLVVYPFQVLPGQPKVVSGWPPVAYHVSPEGGSLMFRGGRQPERWLAGVYPIKSTGWRVVAVQSEREAFQVLHQLFWPMGALVALLCIVVMVLGLRWAQAQQTNARLLQYSDQLARALQEASSRQSSSGPPPAPNDRPNP